MDNLVGGTIPALHVVGTCILMFNAHHEWKWALNWCWNTCNATTGR